MTGNETHASVLDAAENGIITSEKVTEMGIHRSALGALVEKGDLIRCSRGIYMLADEWEDELFLLQQRYKKGIYSHATALYLWGYSERVPLSFHMTFPTNYNSRSLTDANVIVTRVIPDNYELGIAKTVTPAGNEVNVYDVERALCDVVRGSGDDIQTVQYAMKKYAASKDKDINKLTRYAKQLRVEPRIRQYMEVLL